ncbi:O-antigen ligase family protein [Klenkia terrae]|uniref:O-antigen ligase family protein n=1 Tax=Klenkia terrae TaxID=1052259 RepID=UPI001CD861B0|nr:O-antigen ligase family protein [Klenkia terrae]
MSAAVFNRSKRQPGREHLGTALLAISTLTLIGILRGVEEYGIGPTIVEARLILLPLTAVAWASSVGRSWEIENAVFRSSLVYLGFGLVVVALYHSVRFGVGTSSSRFITIDGVEQSSRVLTQIQALMLLLGALVAVERWISGRGRIWFWVAALFLLSIVISQQRSVWLASVAALVVAYACSDRSRRGRFNLAFALAAVAGLVGLAAVPAAFAGILGSGEDTATYDSRSYGWGQLLQLFWDSGWTSRLFGLPFGAGFDRLDTNGLLVSFSPHNWYLLILLRLGLIGLAAFIYLIFSSMRSVLRRPDRRIGAPVAAAVLVFCWTYGLSWVLAIFLARSVTGFEPADRGAAEMEPRKMEKM